ncbi:class I SAM-dependent methyltransferase [Streptomyces sp. NPDC004609]|uniref:class I SAM-dependent methyltransferase n=1 Tax=Streptomyces sp. NPDC004609 TaxID=3364704 RepID=UPI0036A7DB92
MAAFLTDPPSAPFPGAGPADTRYLPDVAAPPALSRLRTAAAERFVRRTLGGLPLRVRFGGGELIGFGGPLLEVHEPRAFVRRIGAGGFTGFAESYAAGEWDAPDPVGVLTVLAASGTPLAPVRLRRPRRGAGPAHRPPVRHLDAAGHPARSGELFGLFLDETLSYSCAVFRGFPAEEHLLATAQRRACDRLLDLVNAAEGTQLLEIGAGRGELAIRAARRGARVLAIALTRERRDLARMRVLQAGLEDRVSVLLRDYRKVLGRFDAIVSVETIETVGAELWPDWFMTLDRLLVPGGRAALQTVTVPHEWLVTRGGTPAWSGAYISPGVQPPSARAIEEISLGCTALRPAGRDTFGPHYAETLRLWRERFTARSDEAGALGFDTAFRRMWTFHLACAEAGFRAGCLDLEQLLFTKAEE